MNHLAYHMKSEFAIYKGEIKFLNNQIQIRDGIYNWQKKMSAAYAVIIIFFGIWEIYKHFTSHHIWIFFIGPGCILFGIVGLITGSRLSTGTVFNAGQVQKAVISHDFASYLNLTLYLKNSQKRKIQLDYRDEDRFEKLYLNEPIETMKSYSIETEIK